MSAWNTGGPSSSPNASCPFRSCDRLIQKIEQNCPLKDLVILPNKNFTAADIERLAVVLERHSISSTNGGNATAVNTHWTCLQASGHAVSTASLERLARAISAAGPNSAFASISVGKETMSDEGVIAFCRGLLSRDNKPNALKEIDFSFKNISATGFWELMRVLAHTSPALNSLNVSRNSLSARARIEFLSEVNTDKESESTEKSCSDISGFNGTLFPNMAEMNMSDCGIGVDFFEQENSQKLFSRLGESIITGCALWLNNNPLGPKGFQVLQRLGPCGAAVPLFKWTSELHVVNCDLSNESMGTLLSTIQNSPLTSSPGESCLKILDLSNNNITEEGALSLAGCILNATQNSSHPFSNLSEINLSGNHFGQKGITALVDAIASVEDSPLRSLDLSQTLCGVDGATAAIQKCCNLVSLRLFDNSLGDPGFFAISDLLVKSDCALNLEYLDLAGNKATKESVVKLLQGLLQRLERGKVFVTDEPTKDMQSNLKTLIIGGNEGGEDVEDVVTKLQMIQPKLDIARDKVRRRI